MNFSLFHLHVADPVPLHPEAAAWDCKWKDVIFARMGEKKVLFPFEVGKRKIFLKIEAMILKSRLCYERKPFSKFPWLKLSTKHILRVEATLL